MANECNNIFGSMIIILIIVWYMYNTSENTQCQYKKNRESMYNYGNNPIKIGSSSGLKYIRSVNGTLEVPNSKTSMRHLFDDNEYECKLTNDQDNTLAVDYLLQKNMEIYYNPNVTSSRNLIV